MKTDNDYSEIGDQLRSRKPECVTPPFLQARILHALEGRAPETRVRPWGWLAATAGLAALAVAAWSLPEYKGAGDSRSLARATPKEAQTIDPQISPQIDVAGLLDKNPLDSTTAAVGDDLKRAGGFLIRCFPTLEGAGQ